MNIRIEDWTEEDFGLLQCLNAPEMTEHLGGPETEEQVVARHARYLAIRGKGAGRMFAVKREPGGEPAGSVGYWDRTWQGVPVYEIGWGVLPAFQGKGIATAAVAMAIEEAKQDPKRDLNRAYIHAYPSVDHPASNAVCRKLGFELLGPIDFEYPPGHPMTCNDWRLEL